MNSFDFTPGSALWYGQRTVFVDLLTFIDTFVPCNPLKFGYISSEYLSAFGLAPQFPRTVIVADWVALWHRMPFILLLTNPLITAP